MLLILRYQKSAIGGECQENVKGAVHYNEVEKEQTT